MTCAKFQSIVPFIIEIVERDGNAEQKEHLRTCQVCSDLVADLRHIAERAKLLVPTADPSPRVWQGVQKSLQRESSVKLDREGMFGCHAD
jgi:hypothetical protein